MGARILGVVRGAVRLDALTFTTTAPAEGAWPWQVEHTLALRPLAAGERPALWSAWQALAAVSRWDAATCGHVLTLLRETVPDAEPPAALPALGPDVHPPPPPRATAAHRCCGPAPGATSASSDVPSSTDGPPNDASAIHSSSSETAHGESRTSWAPGATVVASRPRRAPSTAERASAGASRSARSPWTAAA